MFFNMSSAKNKFRIIVICLVFIFFCVSVFRVNIIDCNNESLLIHPIQNDCVLKKSAPLGYKIHIDDSDPSKNWSLTEDTYDWCTGAGTIENPYVIKDIEVDGENVGSCILIENSNVYFIIRNCTVYNSDSAWSEAGIKLVNTSNGILIKNNCSNSNHNGIYLYLNCNNNTILNNIGNNNTANGIYLELNCNNNNISQNIINNNNNYYGICLESNCTNNTISKNNATHNNYYGVYLISNCSNNIISKNKVSHNRVNGIKIRDYCVNNYILNNNASNNGDSGIYLLLNSDKNIITNNTVDSVKAYYKAGIHLYKDCDNNIISENYKIANKGRGVYLYKDCDNNKIWKNVASGSGMSDGICLRSNCNNNNLSANIIENNSGGNGILIYDDCNNNTVLLNDLKNNEIRIEENCNYNRILRNKVNNMFDNIKLESNCCNNSISENTIIGKEISYGILLYGYCNSNYITENNVTKCAHGIWVDLDCSNNIISRNNLDHSGNSGIFLIHNCDNNTITRNNATENYYHGIHIWENCDNNFIKGNNVSNNRNGIKLEDDCDNNRVLKNLANNNYHTSSQYGHGIYLDSNCDNNNLSENTCNNNKRGIYVYLNCYYNNISENNVDSNNIGIYLEWHSKNAIISENNISNNDFGIYLEYDCDSNVFSKNKINENNIMGTNIKSSDCEFNLFFINNFSRNGKNGQDDGINNYWDNGLIGNYWDDYGDQGGYDMDDDGIGDIPYNISGSAYNRDHFPIWDDGVEFPIITINSPILNQIFGNNPPNFNIFIDSSNLDIIWYSIDGGIINITFIENGSIHETEWNKISNGTVIITFYANDSNGDEGYAEVNVFKDIVVPQITINSPSLNEIYGNKAPNYNISIIEGNLNTTWYTLDGGSTNYTFSGTIGTINQTFWDTLGDGIVIIRFYANDTLGNRAFKDLTIRKDTDSPIITFEFSGFFLNTTTPEYFHLGLLVICTVSDVSDVFLVYLNENSRGVWVNRLMIDLGNGNWSYVIDISGLGWSNKFSISFFANDSVGNIGINDNSTILYTIKIFDFQKPSTTISFEPYSGINNVNESTLFNLAADDGLGSGISVIRYKINDSNWIDYDGVFDLSGYTFGDYIISYYTTDIAGNVEEIKTLLVILVDVSELTPSPIIPGYDLILLISLICVVSIILIKKRHKF